jgi:glycosyltransferase involved in cell wall biosynthesis
MTAGQPQKVVFILPSYDAGGAERVLITLMNKLDHNRFQPEFISFTTDGPLKKLIESDIPVHSIGHFKKVYFGLVPFARKLREINPDIAVTTMAHTNFALLLLKPFLPHTRIIVREAITPSFIIQTKKSGWLVKLLYKLLYPHADLVISPSQRIIDEFDTLIKTDIRHHKLLYNPVNIDVIRAMPQILENKDDNRNKTVHFVCAGRLHYQKGFDRLINALPFFKSSYDWKLTILGDGSERKNLEALIEKHKLQDKVTLHGFTKTPWPHIGEADCFLLPSRFEGLPNVALESLAVGTPVIATTSAGGINEIAAVADDHVTLVETMPEFIDAMAMVKPTPTRTYRNSLLPGRFETDKVVKRFMDMLEGREEFSVEATKPKLRQSA